MKTLIWFFLTVYSVSFAQSKRTLEPIRGHYADLQRFSVKSSNSKLDTQHFLVDKVVKERRLSMKPVFLNESKEFALPAPPANTSEQTRKELNYLLGLQAQRTDLDIKVSLHMANVYYNPRTDPSDSNYHLYRKNLFFIGRSIGTWFNPDSLPKTTELMAKVWRDASYFIWKYKYEFVRVRPYVLDSTIQNLEDTDWPAYPSGHAANSYINAYLFSALAPQFTDIFLKDAYDMAHSREILGVHFPSDSESSRVLAREFVNALFDHEDFRKEFAAVKEEWKLNAKESFYVPIIKKALKEPTACKTTCKE